MNEEITYQTPAAANDLPPLQPETTPSHEASLFENQVQLFTDICDRFTKVLFAKNFDFANSVSESNSPLFKRALDDRERLTNDLADFKNDILAQFKQETLDSDHKRLTLLTAFDTLRYFAEQIATLFTIFHQFSPATNRGISPHRSLAQDEGKIDINELIKSTFDRDSKETAAKPSTEIASASPYYGRYTFEYDFSELHHNLAATLHADGGAHGLILDW